MSAIKNRHNALDAEILDAVKANNSEAIRQKVKLQKTLVDMLDNRDQAQTDFDYNKIASDELYQKLKADGRDDLIQQMIDRTMNQEDYKTLSDAYGVNHDVNDIDETALNLLRVPDSVTTRLKNDYEADDEGLQKALEKLSGWKLLRKKQQQGESNTIEAPDGKKISVLMSEFKEGEVFQNTNTKKSDYSNTRYVKGRLLKQTVDQAGKKLWRNKSHFTGWISQYVPGKTIQSKYRNFIELLDLEKSGTRLSSGEFVRMGAHGHFWIFCGMLDKSKAGEIDFPGDTNEVYVYLGESNRASCVICFE